MVASRVEGEAYFHVDNVRFNSDISKTIASILPHFDKIIKGYIHFHLFFAVLFVVEVILFLVFFPSITLSAILAFSIAGIFLTVFSFFIFRIYYQAKKGEQYEEFISKYTRGCHELIGFREGIPEHHIALANGYSRLARELSGRQTHLFYSPRWLNSLHASIERVSDSCFWNDVFLMREALFEKSIQEHVKLVKSEPTSLDIHAALANAYVILSSLYLSVLKPEHRGAVKWSLSMEGQKELEEKFRATASKAIEEFKILNNFAPNDPWVHTQLAYSYRDLKMPEEEINEYEIILGLRSDDADTMYKLGCLYFQQERNAEGLKIYEKLRQINYKKAELLIDYYGGIPSVMQNSQF